MVRAPSLLPNKDDCEKEQWYHVEFTIDASVPCTARIHYLIKETPKGNLVPSSNNSTKSDQLEFEAGMNQQFCMLTHRTCPEKILATDHIANHAESGEGKFLTVSMNYHESKVSNGIFRLELDEYPCCDSTEDKMWTSNSADLLHIRKEHSKQLCYEDYKTKSSCWSLQLFPTRNLWNRTKGIDTDQFHLGRVVQDAYNCNKIRVSFPIYLVFNIF